jgi:hypothetical protein
VLYQAEPRPDRTNSHLTLFQLRNQRPRVPRSISSE